MQLTSSLFGTRMTWKVAGPPRPSPQATRQVTCMAKKKGIRCIVTLECQEARGEGATPSRYITQKNRKNTTGRMELKKYNPHLKRHTVHKEIK